MSNTHTISSYIMNPSLTCFPDFFLGLYHCLKTLIHCSYRLGQFIAITVMHKSKCHTRKHLNSYTWMISLGSGNSWYTGRNWPEEDSFHPLLPEGTCSLKMSCMSIWVYEPYLAVIQTKQSFIIKWDCQRKKRKKKE